MSSERASSDPANPLAGLGALTAFAFLCTILKPDWVVWYFLAVFLIGLLLIWRAWYEAKQRARAHRNAQSGPDR